MTTEFTIRNLRREDAAAILDIYAYYVRETAVTFDEEVPTLSEFETKILTIAKRYPFIVCETPQGIMGYAYASAWNTRSAYNRCVESSIYLKADQRANGFGSNLYRQLLNQLEKKNFHTVIAGISLPNPESIGFHEKHGFRRSGVLKEVGWKFNRWIDVGLWQNTFNQK